MTPKFAQAIDPVMLHVLGLLERIGRDERPSPADERLRIRGLIDQAEALLGASDQWKLGQGRPQITGKKRDLLGAPPLRGRYYALWSGLALAMAATVLAIMLLY
jgi:hypothetical protein